MRRDHPQTISWILKGETESGRSRPIGLCTFLSPITTGVAVVVVFQETWHGSDPEVPPTIPPTNDAGRDHVVPSRWYFYSSYGAQQSPLLNEVFVSERDIVHTIPLFQIGCLSSAVSRALTNQCCDKKLAREDLRYGFRTHFIL